MFKKISLLLFSFLLFAPFLRAQDVIEKTPGDTRENWYKEYLEMKDASIYANLPWQFVGPTNISGRMTDVAVVAPKGKNYTIYVAGATGGIWKTVNEGVTWTPVFEHQMSTSIGDIELDPQNPKTIWAGTGEANIFRSSNTGAGIYLSKDGGESWEKKGLMNTGTIARILVHPKNSDVLYVAAGGNEWTNNADRGVYKTTDGGATWEKILYIDEMTGAYDLVMDPTDPEVVYAATWQRIRKKWNDPRTSDDYKNTGLYKTTDGGKNWKEINKGLPAPNHRGRIGIDLCQAHPQTLYAFVDNYEKLEEEHELNEEEDAYGRPSSGRIKGATVYRSDDGGENWHQTSEQNEFMENMSGTYGWVFGQLRVDPVDPDKVYAMGLRLNVSVDGGKTFRSIGDHHADQHGLWIDPENTNYLVNVNDGGIAISYDGENFRTFYDNLPLVQFFNVGIDNSEPFKVYGSIQDHGSFRGEVNLRRGRDQIPAVEFERAPGWEGSRHVINPKNPDIVYAASFYGDISRTNVKTGGSKGIMPPAPEGVDRLRGQWLAPFILSPHNPGILYHATQVINRSMDEGDTWECISPDLTYNKPEMKGDIPYQTIFALSESPLKFGVIYAGTDDGRVWMTPNSGDEWKEINKGLPYRKWVSHMEASRFADGRVYMTQNGKRDDDHAAYIWKSEDFGQSWESIKSNIPYGPVNVIREDPKYENILYVGTDYGVYVSTDRGESWQTLVGNLPTTYVHDIQIHERDDIAVCATHGRGIWAIDLKSLREVAGAVAEEADVKILEIEEMTTPRGRRLWREPAPMRIPFFLGKAGTVTVSISNPEGKELFSEKREAVKGLNYAQWKMKDSADEYAEAGTYKVKISGKGFEDDKEIVLKASQRR